MTIAIGAEFDGGTVVCADTKIVATDGATSSGSKVSLSVTPKRMAFAIASAADDAHAASMLAGDMTSAACDSEHGRDLQNKLKETMTTWYSAYGAMKPPALHFLLSCGGRQTSNLYFCEPPNTVLRASHVMAIGQGARPIETLMNALFWPIPKFGVKSALLRLAYLMYRAKNEEGSACGGNTTTVVVTKGGAFTFVEDEEMRKAEDLASRVDDFLGDFRKQILSAEPKDAKEVDMKRYVEMIKEAENMPFSLEWLEKTGWKTTKQKSKAK